MVRVRALDLSDALIGAGLLVALGALAWLTTPAVAVLVLGALLCGFGFAVHRARSNRY